MHLAIDLETTGLYPADSIILEAAVMLVDNDTNVVDQFEAYIDDETEEFHYAMVACMEAEDQFVNKMHTESGLWEAHSKGPTLTNEEFSSQVLDMLTSHGVGSKQVPMLGNSIGSLDRPFVQYHMPRLDKFLSHRNLDISSLRLVLDARAPHIQQEWEELTKSMDHTTHRAMDDIRLCLKQYRFYCDRLGI